MKTLIDDILALEEEAERILETARQDAQHKVGETDAAVARFDSDTASAVEERVAEYRRAAEARHREAVLGAQESLALELNRVKTIPDGRIAQQAQRVAVRFQDL